MRDGNGDGKCSDKARRKVLDLPMRDGNDKARSRDRIDPAAFWIFL